VDTSNLEAVLKEHIQRDQSRLDRIELKIDKLSDTVIALARAEEKLITLEANKLEVIKRLNEHEERLDTHADRLNSGAITLNTINKVFWLALAAAVVVITDLYLR
jgi:cell division protein FtsL